MENVVRNGSPSAGMYLLGAVFLAVAVLAVAGIRGREDTSLFLRRDAPSEMIANGIDADALGDYAECAQWSEFRATIRGYVLECRYDTPREEGSRTTRGLAFDFDRFGNVIGIRPLD